MFPTELIPYVQDYFPTGSRVICNPPVLDTDEDWAVLAVYKHWSPTRKLLKDKLLEDGWSTGGSGDGSTNFQSWKKGDLNLIVFHSVSGFARYRLATRIATALNLLKKDDRITLFSMIQDCDRMSDTF